jgi:glucosamine-6-phosphate deaminase
VAKWVQQSNCRWWQKIINATDMKLHDAHFRGMDEWVGTDGKPVPMNFPLSFAKTDMDFCFNQIRPELQMPASNLHFPLNDLLAYSDSYDSIRCILMQGGQGDTKHWAVNDPVRREGQWADAPPTPEEYRQLKTRHVELHPMTIMQNTRTSGCERIDMIPAHVHTVGPYDQEIKYLLECITQNKPADQANFASAADSVRIILAEAQSAEQGGCRVNL